MSDQELHLRKLIDQLERENAALRAEKNLQGLHLATMADVILGDNAKDRSDELLVREACNLSRAFGLLIKENAALKQRCETCETAAVIDSYVRKYDALRASAVEVCAIARVWATVWHDKLSLESIRRFTELEQQILKRGSAANDAAREGKP